MSTRDSSSFLDLKDRVRWEKIRGIHGGIGHSSEELRSDKSPRTAKTPRSTTFAGVFKRASEFTGTCPTQNENRNKKQKAEPFSITGGF